MKRILLLTWILLVGTQVQCDTSFEMTNGNNSNFEGSAGSNVPSDDEDMIDGSGSGQDPVFEDEPEVTESSTVKMVDSASNGKTTNSPSTTEIAVAEDDLAVKNGNVLATGSIFASANFMTALIVGGCVGLLFAVCVIMLLAYRMRKKDEGSYALDEQKKPASPSYPYTQGQEYYA